MRRIVLVVGLFAIACGPPGRPRDDEDVTCDRPCENECCATGEACLENACVACTPKTCAELRLACGDAADECGGTLSCGSCPDGLACGGSGVAGRCGTDGCTAESDEELCAAQGRACGSLEATDACGVGRSIASCGSCSPPQTCGGSGRLGVCGAPGEECVPETDRQLCTRMGRSCSALDAFDNCDASRHVNSCGSCTAPQSCGGGGRAGVCGCTGESERELCVAAGAQCGQVRVTDRCNVPRTLECGGCSAPNACGGGGQPNRCGCSGETNEQLCAANALECGTASVRDRCGRTRTVSCGGCTTPVTCGGGGQANRCGCTAETDEQLCTAAGARCGSVTRTDRCGRSRTVGCGGCTRPETCGGAGVPNHCGCTAPETDESLCDAAGYECGEGTFTDSCGRPRPVASCGTCRAPETCDASWLEPHACSCVGEEDSVLCGRVGYACGPLTATDKCGVTRELDCGTCRAPATCNAQRKCFCEAETNDRFCTRRSWDCGSVTAADNCGTERTVSCGTCGAGLTCGTLNRCSAWTVVNAGTTLDLGGIWGVAANEIYATAGSESSANPRLFKWNGTAWTASPRLTTTGLTLDRATDVWATSGAVFVAGSGTDSTGRRKGVILRSAGSATWSSVSFTTVLQVDGAFWNVRGTSATNVFATGPGLATTPPTLPVLKRWDGTNWTDIPLPASVDADEMLQGLMPFSASDLFFTANSGDRLWRWNGSTVTHVPAPHPGYFDAWGSSPTDVWMSGSDGHLAHWNGTTITDRSIAGSTSWFYDLHGTGPDDVWAVGSSSTIAHWSGGRWVLEPAPVSSSLQGVWATATDVWAVGSRGAILRRRR